MREGAQRPVIKEYTSYMYKELPLRAAGRGEGPQGLRKWLGDIITAVSCGRGWMSKKTMLSGGKVDDTHAPD